MEDVVIIAIEGADCVGKTTQTIRVETQLRDILPGDISIRMKSGVSPGQTDQGCAINEVIRSQKDTLSITGNAILHVADHLETMNFISPMIDGGSIFIFDSFIDSTLVYQGLFHSDVMYERVKNLYSVSGATLVPDLTICIDLDPDIAVERMSKSVCYTVDSSTLDTQKRIRSAYKKLGRIVESANSRRCWTVVDGNKRASSLTTKIHNLIIKFLSDRGLLKTA
jgi:thymidylate kinase